MSDMSRKEAIENLETLKAFLDVNGVFIVSDAMKKSIDIAIASLETDEAYQLMEEQPEFCEDCISREYIGGCINKDAHYTGEEILSLLETMPSVLPKVKWISVSEKLPHDRDWYLGIFKEPDTGWVNTLPFICDYVGRETKATTKGYWILRGLTDIDNPLDYYKNLECVAWMPLPKPYSEVEE